MGLAQEDGIIPMPGSDLVSIGAIVVGMGTCRARRVHPHCAKSNTSTHRDGFSAAALSVSCLNQYKSGINVHFHRFGFVEVRICASVNLNSRFWCERR